MNSEFYSLGHTNAPDIFTASDEYRRRFSGPVGAYFLERQSIAVQSLLSEFSNRASSNRELSILEVGGGHLQVTQELLDLGHSVTLHGSSEEALSHSQRLLSVKAEAAPGKIRQLVCPIEELSNLSERFDLVIALRLIPHVLDERELLRILLGLSKEGIIFDFASMRGLNALAALGFGLKKKIERNTRPFFSHHPGEIREFLQQQGCKNVRMIGQFVFPMGLHRAVNSRAFSALIEGTLSPLSPLFGNPIICGAWCEQHNQ